jgi:hypothetical protein
MPITNTAPGLSQPTMIGMQAGNPKDSAIASQNLMNQKQASLNSAVGGRRNKKGGEIAVPQFQMQYTPQGGTGQDPNALIQQNSQTSTQSVENASMDLNALVKGGKKISKKSKKSKKGGNANWEWGCSSGGKSRKKRSSRTNRSKRQIKTRQTRKNRKSRRNRR